MAECEHMQGAPEPEPDARSTGCEECLRIGQSWVHLRKCVVCGHVGCCDSSVGKHATRHARETGHPVMRSAEPGEDWRYCTLDGEMAWD